MPANESQQKPKPRRQHSTHKKKTGWNKRCPNRCPGRTIICVNIWCTTQLAKLSFNHSHGSVLTADVFQLFIKYTYTWYVLLGIFSEKYVYIPRKRYTPFLLSLYEYIYKYIVYNTYILIYIYNINIYILCTRYIICIESSGALDWPRKDGRGKCQGAKRPTAIELVRVPWLRLVSQK